MDLQAISLETEPVLRTYRTRRYNHPQKLII